MNVFVQLMTNNFSYKYQIVIQGEVFSQHMSSLYVLFHDPVLLTNQIVLFAMFDLLNTIKHNKCKDNQESRPRSSIINSLE